MSSYADPVIRHAFFCKFEFLSGPYYVWTGFRNLSASGIIWRPTGPMATVGTIEDAVSDSAPAVILTVSGVDTALLALALSETDQVRGQLAFIYDMFFDENWQPDGAMENYAVVRMDTLKIKKQKNQDESWTQVIEITGENFLTNGPCPPYGRYSNADQWAREGNNNDLYFQYMAINQNQRQRWPTF